MLKRVLPLAVALGAVILAALPAQAASSPLEPMYANDAVVFMKAPLAVAAGQSHGIHETMTRPGPHSCPWLHRSG